MELRIGISARVEIGPRLEIRIHGYRWGRRIGVLGRKRNRGRKLIFSRLVRIDRRALNERIKAEISQEDLAEFAGISVATLSKLERGLVLPTVETSFRLAKALNMTMSELFTFNF